MLKKPDEHMRGRVVKTSKSIRDQKCRDQVTNSLLSFVEKSVNVPDPSGIFAKKSMGFNWVKRVKRSRFLSSDSSLAPPVSASWVLLDLIDTIFAIGFPVDAPTFQQPQITRKPGLCLALAKAKNTLSRGSGPNGTKDSREGWSGECQVRATSQHAKTGIAGAEKVGRTAENKQDRWHWQRESAVFLETSASVLRDFV
ncbi:hypothetical protein AA313_de0210135 [Arthrobotrys entomopaga]|nr:hypothetical protein AA313_de0210135 [Arthrobotrys entomopaga]